MSFPRYPAYKDSGVDGLGELPEHWALTRLKFVANVQTGVAKGKDNVGKETLEVPYLRVANVQDGYLALDDVATIEIPLEDLPRYRLQAGDVLMNEGGDFDKLGRGHVWDGSIEPCIHQNHVFAVRPHGVSPGWLNLLTGSTYAQFFFMVRSKQSTNLASISSTNVMELPVLLPPVVEQAVITEFLSKEVTKIDALVAEQERLIELLKEKRQAVISHAVTKGLDPSVPMKDSGVEWLGKVPAHWEVARVKHLVQTFEQGWSPQCESFPVGSESEWGVLKVGCVNGGIFTPEENKALPPDLTPLPELGISAGDLLISRANTRELVGSAAVASADHHNLMLCDKLYRLRVDAGRCLPTFLSLFLGTEQVRGQIELAATGASSSMLNISQSTILELCLALPPMAEQQELLQAAVMSVAQLDQLVGEAVLSIELLRERRTALISAAVTGQIDVRAAAATD
ncbi:restriction endonuclease subunit S [Hydrogenophaga electricum]|uniref:Type I restriction-modification protein subunit S n=1 Tax=Hydrogenophaga electricum TaxID=1230953 RepID=A0ABQ6C7M1_9BURK|nr:restriction endonuclease subunit S [Hydrogenophaga electricum]GLS15623.1 type I restriction-modification protein subunit S [Hydrogenophaga electricum]